MLKMRRKGIMVTAAVAATCIGVLSMKSALSAREAGTGEGNEAGEQDFKICQSFNFTTGDYKDTVVNVVADTSAQDVKELYKRIQDFQTSMNGESDRLTINLYNSTEDMSGNICAGTKVYYREEAE